MSYSLVTPQGLSSYHSVISAYVDLLTYPSRRIVLRVAQDAGTYILPNDYKAGRVLSGGLVCEMHRDHMLLHELGKIR